MDFEELIRKLQIINCRFSYLRIKTAYGVRFSDYKKYNQVSQDYASCILELKDELLIEYDVDDFTRENLRCPSLKALTELMRSISEDMYFIYKLLKLFKDEIKDDDDY